MVCRWRCRPVPSTVSSVPMAPAKRRPCACSPTLTRPSRGEAWVAGHSIHHQRRDVRRAIGYMPDEFGVYDDLRVWEYLDFFAACYDIPESERRPLVSDLLELVDLAHRRDDMVDQLSRGMKQRLSLARTLAHDPQVLILDEPASGLDPRARVEIRELLVTLASMGKTVFFSTHILADVSEICSHIGIIEAGKMIIQGSMADNPRRADGAPRNHRHAGRCRDRQPRPCPVAQRAHCARCRNHRPARRPPPAAREIRRRRRGDRRAQPATSNRRNPGTRALRKKRAIWRRCSCASRAAWLHERSSAYLAGRQRAPGAFPAARLFRAGAGHCPAAGADPARYPGHRRWSGLPGAIPAARGAVFH